MSLRHGGVDEGACPEPAEWEAIQITPSARVPSRSSWMDKATQASATQSPCPLLRPPRGLLAMTGGPVASSRGAVRQTGWATLSWIASSALGFLAMTGGGAVGQEWGPGRGPPGKGA